MIWLRRSAWVAGAMLLLLLVAWIAVPTLIKWQLPLRASEALGRHVTLGNATFHPWNLDLTLNDMAIAGSSGTGESLLQVGTLHTNFSVSSLFRLAPVIEDLEVDHLRLRVARTSEGHYDVDDLIARFTPKDVANPTDGTGHFALYNVQVRDAQLRFDDQPVKRVQQVDDLRLSLPFISNLPAQVEVKVEPRLAFKLNGATFDTGAQATPFAQTRSGDLKLQVSDLDLSPYLGYVPATLPVRVTQGNVSADIDVVFSVPPNGIPNVVLKGTAGVDRLALTDTAGAPLLTWERMSLGLRDVQPLARSLAFGSLRVDGLQLHAVRDAQGHMNLLALAEPSQSMHAAVRAEVTPAPASAASAAGRIALPPWKVNLASLTLAEARVLWNDAVVKPAAALQIDGLNLEAKDLQWPLAKPIPLSLQGALRDQMAGGPVLAKVSADGSVTDHEAKMAVTLSNAELGSFAPYLAQVLSPSIDGQLNARADLDWSSIADARRLRLHLATLSLDRLKVREAASKPSPDTLALEQLALADVDVDLLARTVALGSVELLQPAIRLARDKAGRFNVEDWPVAVAATVADVPASAPVRPAIDASRPWRVQLKALALDDGQVHFSDAVSRHSPGEPVGVELGKLRVRLQDLAWQGGQALPPVNLQVSAQVGGASHDRPRASGAIDYQGRIGLQPLLANGHLKIERFPVQVLGPYFADLVQLTLLHAEAGYDGSVDLRGAPAGYSLDAAGDVLLGDVRVATLPEPGSTPNADNTDELLSWQAFALKGVKVAVRPQARPRVDIAQATLTDFYSRLVVTEQGRFNLRDVAGRPDENASPAARAAPVPAVAASALPVGDTSLPIDVRVGATILTNGRVDYTDHFIRPNYSAALTDLNGQLGAISTSSHDMATLSLRGHAEGTALLDINGQINPLAKPLALDIHAKATDLELAPLSPYAGKYVGYAIERGKLTMDLAYKIDPDGKLNATNQVVLNQLIFGDRIDSKDAVKLPVLLAVALLKDRHGVIDVDLPVSGSINDPKFSVGGLIFKVIVNLLTKALTSPFSLLAGGGGGDELSQVAFKPGTAQMDAAGVATIDKVVKALTDRPALKMTVTGAADTAAERSAFQTAAIEQRLVDEKRLDVLRAGAPATPASAPVNLSVDDRVRLLKEVYEDTDIPDKPRNAIGFAKNIPGLDMENLLKAQVTVNDDVMRDLALKRGMAVRDALLAKGLPSDRLFLAAPTLVSAPAQATGWTPTVQLSLDAN